MCELTLEQLKTVTNEQLHKAAEQGLNDAIGNLDEVKMNLSGVYNALIKTDDIHYFQFLVLLDEIKSKLNHRFNDLEELIKELKHIEARIKNPLSLCADCKNEFNRVDMTVTVGSVKFRCKDCAGIWNKKFEQAV